MKNVVVKTDCPVFSVGETVLTNFPKSGSSYGKVVMAVYNFDNIKGELSYSFSYDEPFPQVIVEGFNGKHYRANANELLSGCLTKIDKHLHEYLTPRTVCDWFNTLTKNVSEFDYSEYAYTGEVSSSTLYENLSGISQSLINSVKDEVVAIDSLFENYQIDMGCPDTARIVLSNESITVSFTLNCCNGVEDLKIEVKN